MKKTSLLVLVLISTLLLFSQNPPGSYTSGTGSGNVSGTGTSNTITKFTGITIVGNSLLTDDGTIATYTGTGGIASPGFTSTDSHTSEVNFTVGVSGYNGITASTVKEQGPSTIQATGFKLQHQAWGTEPAVPSVEVVGAAVTNVSTTSWYGLSGNSTTLGTTSGVLTNGHNAGFDSNGNIVDNGVPSTGLGYTLSGFTTTGVSPADGEVRYFGAGLASPQNTFAPVKVYVPKAGTVKTCWLHSVVTGTLGTSEAVTILFTKNDSTTISTGTTTWDSLYNSIYVDAVASTAVAAGDYIAVKYTAPTWATNPTIVFLAWQVYIE